MEDDRSDPPSPWSPRVPVVLSNSSNTVRGTVRLVLAHSHSGCGDKLSPSKEVFGLLIAVLPRSPNR